MLCLFKLLPMDFLLGRHKDIVKTVTVTHYSQLTTLFHGVVTKQERSSAFFRLYFYELSLISVFLSTISDIGMYLA